MPHFAHTPEALLGRNDSKNPSTTCKGITTSGRPCRRALAASRSSLTGRRKSDNSALGGVVAVVEEDGEIQGADFYCWQHKEQAEKEADDGGPSNETKGGRRTARRKPELYPLKEKSSIDTMVQKLGIDAATDNGRQQQTNNPRPPRKTHTTDFATGQPHTIQAPYAEKYNLGRVSQQPSRKPKKRGLWASLCCMSGDDDDYVEIVRHKARVEQSQMSQATPVAPAHNRRTQRYRASTDSAPVPGRKPMSGVDPPKPASPPRHSDPQTTDLLSLIPTHLPPQTTSALLAELTKPISANDEEGYIYIFWLTPQSKSAPPESTARSLLSPQDTSRRPRNARRISEVITEYSFDGDETDTDPGQGRSRNSRKPSTQQTIMLKIGRASNITRRMNEWQRQCGYALNLVRWYPYVSSTPQQSPQHERNAVLPDLTRPPFCRGLGGGEGVQKVPCVKRVERLIHIELAERQVKRQCSACGKEHREWFEVDASQAGVKGVDEVVRRWVGWGERQIE